MGKLITALSYLIMKIAHHKIEEKQKEEGVTGLKVYCTFTWIIGLLCGITGGILNVIMLPFCGLVLLSTTVGISIIFSNFLAMRFLGEKLVWKYDLLAFFLVVGGCTTIVLLSVSTDQTLTPEQIKQFISSI